MKIKAFLVLCMCIVTAVAVSSHVSKKQDLTNAGSGFAFVELFTSEGCSSCPPAEQLIEKVVNENSKRVYIVTYHVDYWDRLGWKDPFSRHDYSAHQYNYAKQFHLSSVYTPQVVVNGQSEFTGSNEIALRSAIRSRLNANESARITLSGLEVSSGKCTLHYALEDAGTSAGLTFVLLQKKALVSVKSGENGGRTLTHVNIVRDIQELPAGRFSGDFSVTIPKDISDGNWDLLCYAKNYTSGEILSVRSIQEAGASTGLPSK